jgi:hypothetical protein
MKNPVPYMQQAMVVFAQAKVIHEMVEFAEKANVDIKAPATTLKELRFQRDRCFSLAADYILKEEASIQ